MGVGRRGQHTAELLPSGQTGRKARRQVIKACSSPPPLRLSFLHLGLSNSDSYVSPTSWSSSANSWTPRPSQQCGVGGLQDRRRQTDGSTDDELHISGFLNRVFFTRARFLNWFVWTYWDTLNHSGSSARTTRAPVGAVTAISFP